MRSSRIVTLALAFAAGSASIAGAQSPTPQPHSYWHVWVDGAGTTHQSKCPTSPKSFLPVVTLPLLRSPLFSCTLRLVTAKTVLYTRAL